MLPGMGGITGFMTGKGVPVFVSASVPARGVTPFTINKPAGVVDGDMMLACVTQISRQAITGVPAGWTLLVDRAGNSPCVYYKIAASEGSDYTFSWSAGFGNCLIVAYRNVTSIIAVGVMSDNNAPAPSISPAQAGVLLAFSAATGSGFGGPPAGMTERALQYTDAPSHAAFDLIPSPAGETGTKTYVWGSGTSNSVLVQIG